MSQKSIEHFLLWFVPISLISFVAGSLSFVIHDHEMLASLANVLGWPPMKLAAYLKLSQPLVFVAANLVVAIWLAFQPHPSSARRALWSLFGLASGLLAVVIWLLVQLLATKHVADS